MRADDDPYYLLAPIVPAVELHGTRNMDKVTRYEWHGSGIILFLLSIFVFTLPLAAVYFITNLLRIESAVSDSEKLSDFLWARERGRSR